MTKDQFDFFERYKIDDEKAKKLLESSNAAEQLDQYFKSLTEDVVNDFASNLSKALPFERPISRQPTQKNNISELANSFTNDPAPPLKEEMKNHQPKEPSSHENQTEKKKEPSINYVHENQKEPQKSYYDNYTKKPPIKKKKKEKIIKPIRSQKKQKKKLVPAKNIAKKSFFKTLTQNIQLFTKKIFKDKSRPSSLKTKHIDLDRMKKVEQEISDLHDPNNKGTTF